MSDGDMPLMRGRGKIKRGRNLNPGRGSKRARGSGRLMQRSDFSSTESVKSLLNSSEGIDGEPHGHHKTRGFPMEKPNEDASQHGFGFRRLDALSKQDGLKIMEILSEKETQNEFVNLSRKKELKEDWIILIVKVLSKLCTAEFHDITAYLLTKICSNSFMDALLLFVIGIDEDVNEVRKKSLGQLFEALGLFYDGIIKLIPTLACEKLGKHIKQSMFTLSSIDDFDGKESAQTNFKFINEKLKVEKEKREREPVKLTKVVPVSPPDDFRDLEVYPTVDDILSPYRPFLRPNLKVGAYKNVEDYLDVQFRLMREDFIRPLREGIEEYRKKMREFGNDSKRKMKVDNIRIYEKVKFLRVRPEEDRLCLELCFDAQKKMCAKVNWEHSKRFMLGSLLLLTKDNFSTILLMTVAKRNTKDLEEGKVLVENCEGCAFQEVFNGLFLMVESQTFFGSYSPVLKALKNFNDSSFPLKQYLVEGSCEPLEPEYLTVALNTQFLIPLPGCTVDYQYDDEGEVAIREDEVMPINIKEGESWPSPEVLGLDASQQRALKGGLTRKLMLIQGPPGTGKTFLGLKIVHSLLLNDEVWRSSRNPTPILIVCYTNHALDQFLSGIKAFTDKIVRVGGRCKEPELEQFGLRHLRRTRLPGRGTLYQMLRQHRIRFKEIKDSFESIDKAINLLESNLGIVSPESLLFHGVMEEGQFSSFRSPDHFFNWLEEGALEGMRQSVFALLEHAGFTNIDIEDNLFGSVNQETCIGLTDMHFLLSFSKLQEQIARLQSKPGAASKSVCYILNEKILFYRHQLKNPLTDPKKINLQRISRTRSLWVLKNEERWQLYRHWVQELLQMLSNNSKQLEPRYREAANLLNQGRMVEDLAIMANNWIVGMTTTYAAAHQAILKQLKPCIVIVEEAAEIMESHIVVSLAGNVEQLILIGDHQQLRPNPAVHELGVKFHLDVSLFERLLNNKVECATLSTQHRMRREIAELISPAIYPQLKNHSSVETFPDVRGMNRNVFFLHHCQAEEEVQEIQSYRNTHEALFLLSLSRYLILQGYEPSKITMLCTYKGQMFFLSKLQKEHPHLTGIRITVVDNFQGEENDIILLSLVRSNQDNSVGFLKIENRVCVALSRARHGLFIIGNMENLTAKGDIWPKIKEVLIRQNTFVEEMVLRCEVHSTLTSVKTREDFDKCPEGGCLKQCGVLMRCGHICFQLCHTTDREHEHFKCMEPCARPACSKNHKCPGRCFEECPPCMVPKTEDLPCGHVAEMQCHVEPLQYRCQVRIVACLEPCKHEKEIYCFQSRQLESVECLVPCAIRLPCGHACEKRCHLTNDPDHKTYKCRKPCEQKNFNCSRNHICGKLCHEECEECSIRVLKDLDCGHKFTMKCSSEPSRQFCEQKCKTINPCNHKCIKKCKDDCHPCLTKVLKLIPKCGHEQLMECGQDPVLFKNCKEPCEKLLSCDHKCTNVCGAKCTETCMENVTLSKVTDCGHSMSVLCFKRNLSDQNQAELLKFCKEPCLETLKCGHKCQGTCGKCSQGRFHEACKLKCSRVLVCGHPCNANCTASCPPCGKACTAVCLHSQCPGRCGEPCPPCREVCARRCEHKRCNLKCYEVCMIGPCNEPCNKKVNPCKHDCISYCGEKCICKECNSEEVGTIFFGSEEDDGARFIMLSDCSHILEATGLQHWMEQDLLQIKQSVCPRCTVPIVKDLRYDKANKIHAADIAKVKIKAYGSFPEIKKTAHDAQALLSNVPHFAEVLKEARKLYLQVKIKLTNLLQTWPKTNRRHKWTPTPPLSLTEAKNLKEFCRILHMVGKLTQPVFKKTSLKDPVQQTLFLQECVTEIQVFVNDLCSNLLKRNMNRLSEQEAHDIGVELERLNCLIILCEVQSFPRLKGMPSDFKERFCKVSNAVRSFKPFSIQESTTIKENLKELAKEAGKNLNLSKQEIQQIKVAVGLSQGHWYKCRNGHIYAIGDCGGANQRGKCPECGEAIGGANHRLEAGNTLASEIDGAVRPAWPM